MQLRIDSPTTDTIDMMVSYTIDYQEVITDLIIKAHAALGSVTRSQVALPSHVTKQVL